MVLKLSWGHLILPSPAPVPTAAGNDRSGSIAWWMSGWRFACCRRETSAFCHQKSSGFLATWHKSVAKKRVISLPPPTMQPRTSGQSSTMCHHYFSDFPGARARERKVQGARRIQCCPGHSTAQLYCWAPSLTHSLSTLQGCILAALYP